MIKTKNGNLKRLWINDFLSWIENLILEQTAASRLLFGQLLANFGPLLLQHLVTLPLGYLFNYACSSVFKVKIVQSLPGWKVYGLDHSVRCQASQEKVDVVVGVVDAAVEGLGQGFVAPGLDSPVFGRCASLQLGEVVQLWWRVSTKQRPIR